MISVKERLGQAIMDALKEDRCHWSNSAAHTHKRHNTHQPSYIRWVHLGLALGYSHQKTLDHSSSWNNTIRNDLRERLAW